MISVLVADHPRQECLGRDELSDHVRLPLEKGEEDKLQQLLGHSIICQIAMGPHVERQVLNPHTTSPESGVLQ